MPSFNIKTPEQRERERLEAEAAEKRRKEAEEFQRKHEEEQRRLEEEKAELERQRQEIEAQRQRAYEEEQKRIEEQNRQREEEERMLREQQELAAQNSKGKKNKNKNKNGLPQNNKIKSNLNSGNLSAEERLQKMYKSLKMKKISFIIIVFVVIAALLIFGTYNTFFKHQMTGQEMTAEVNKYNKESGFPDQGVQGFLKQNINTIIKPYAYFSDKNGASTIHVDPSSIFVTSIVKKSSSIANVFFQCTITTDKGETTHNFYLPVEFNWDKFAYFPAGELELAMRGIENGTTENKGNNMVKSFQGIDEDKANKEDAQKFVENFLIAVYNSDGAMNLGTMYKGAYQLGDPNLSFDSIIEFYIYTGSNKLGYNATVKYVVETTNGLKYTDFTYLNISKSGDSWIINEVL